VEFKNGKGDVMKTHPSTTLLVTIFALALFASPLAAQVGTTWDKQVFGPTRFKVLSDFGNAAVFDKETGLVWERSPSTVTYTPSEAHSHCNTLLLGNRFGWRLPTIQELASLMDPTQANPALNSGHPFSNVISDNSDCYWSATPAFGGSEPPWSVFFNNNGGVTYGGCGSGDGKNVVWCVRGGQGVNPQ
jgi:hypothetical protein